MDKFLDWIKESRLNDESIENISEPMGKKMEPE